MPIRKIIQIDESKCTGCGACVPGCAEAALAIVDGKARLVKDIYCDGLGACLGHCPEGALTVIEREAPDFDEAAALAFAAATGHPAAHKAHPAPAAPVRPGEGCPGAAAMRLQPAAAAPLPGPGGHAAPGGCPGQAVMNLKPAPAAGATPFAPSSGPQPGPNGRPAPLAPAPAGEGANDLMHWPVQIRLVPPDAPFLRGADLVVAADCAAVAVADFHRRFVRDKAILMGCPKFDGDADYAGRFAQLFARSGVRSVTVVRMEVPCCAGLPAMVKAGLAASGRDIPLREIVITRDGCLRPAA
jgi:NAD-dependent dihydropyrimidine dehydrogenase PreA subunit